MNKTTKWEKASYMEERGGSGKFVADVCDLVFKRAVLCHLALDDVDGGKDRRVVAAKDLRRVLEREIGHVADHVNGDMAGKRDLGGTLFALDILDADVIALGNVLNDLFCHERGGNGTGNDTGKYGARRIHGDLGAVYEAVSTKLFDNALKLTDIALDVFAKEAQNLVGKVDVHQLCLALEDGNAKLGIRRLDIHDQTAFETALDTFLQVLDVLGRTVGGENDLLACVVERVEGMEKFFLCGDLTRDELNIVDEEHIRVAVFFLELGCGLLFDGANELVCEVFTLDEDDIEFGCLALDLVCDCFHEVSFAKSGRTVKEEGVIGCGMVGNGDGCRVRELVGAADDKVIERVVLFGNEIGACFSGGVFLLLGRLLFCFFGFFGNDLFHRCGLFLLFCGNAQNLCKIEFGFCVDFYGERETERGFKKLGDLGGVFFVEDLNKALAGRGDERKLAVKISKLEVFEPKVDDGLRILFQDFGINDVPDVLVGVQLFVTVLSFGLCM